MAVVTLCGSASGSAELENTILTRATCWEVARFVVVARSGSTNVSSGNVYSRVGGTVKDGLLCSIGLYGKATSCFTRLTRITNSKGTLGNPFWGLVCSVRYKYRLSGTRCRWRIKTPRTASH